MTLIDDVKRGYEITREGEEESDGPIIIRSQDDELVPGFNAMRAYYEHRLLAVTRRGYRHFAGSTMPTTGDELLRLTAKVMTPNVIGTLIQAFADGVMIGHQSDHHVKISFHFDIVEHIFTDEDFRETSTQMALGFSDDDEVLAFFTEFFTGGLEHLSHMTGFAHSVKVNPGKVWDLWMLIGTATTCSSYLAGYNMGQVWKERDVLDGIAIATEEVPRGADREA